MTRPIRGAKNSPTSNTSTTPLLPKTMAATITKSKGGIEIPTSKHRVIA
jgi:hypothetical protein